MANYVFNIAKGRVVELWNRVQSNDPASACLLLVPLSASGTAEEAQDYNNLSEVLGGSANEQTEGGWERKKLTNTELDAIAVDDTENRFPTKIKEVKMGSPTAGKNTTGLLICYDPKEAEGTDTEPIPLLHLDFSVTADGNEVIINAGEVFRAT